MSVPIFEGRSHAGEIQIQSPGWKEWLISLEDSAIEVVVRRRRVKRSLDQNRYYRVCLRVIFEETGNEEDYMHEFFKRQFLWLDEPGGKRCRSTTELTTEEFGYYLEQVRHFAATRMDVYCPDPERVTER